MKPLRTVLLAIAFVAALLTWAVVYMAEGALDRLIVAIVNAFPEAD